MTNQTRHLSLEDGHVTEAARLQLQATALLQEDLYKQAVIAELPPASPCAIMAGIDNHITTS